MAGTTTGARAEQRRWYRASGCASADLAQASTTGPFTGRINAGEVAGRRESGANGRAEAAGSEASSRASLRAAERAAAPSQAMRSPHRRQHPVVGAGSPCIECSGPADRAGLKLGKTLLAARQRHARRGQHLPGTACLFDQPVGLPQVRPTMRALRPNPGKGGIQQGRIRTIWERSRSAARQQRRAAAKIDDAGDKCRRRGLPGGEPRRTVPPPAPHVTEELRRPR